MERHLIPHLPTGKHILPPNLAIPARQNIAMHAPVTHGSEPSIAPQARRAPVPRRHDRGLHPPLHGLRDPELVPQERHFEAVLLGAPLRQAGFEGVRGVELE